MLFTEEADSHNSTTVQFDVVAASTLARYFGVTSEFIKSARSMASRLGADRLKDQLADCRANLSPAANSSDKEGALKQMFVLAHQLNDQELFQKVLDHPHSKSLVSSVLTTAQDMNEVPPQTLVAQNTNRSIMLVKK